MCVHSTRRRDVHEIALPSLLSFKMLTLVVCSFLRWLVFPGNPFLKWLSRVQLQSLLQLGDRLVLLLSILAECYK